MPLIRPFRGLRFRADSLEYANLISPPYDVISNEQRERLLTRNPRNIIRLILGDPSLQTDGTWDVSRYLQVRELAAEWKSKKFLAQESTPAMYLVEDRFSFEGQTLQRRGLLLTVHKSSGENGMILRHERTLDKPVRDRLALLTAARMHFSPIFTIFEDRNAAARAILSSIASEPAQLDFANPDTDIRHRLWAITDSSLLTQLTELLRPKPFLIADGHHRFEASMEYARQNPTLEEAQWLFMYASPAPDEGLRLSAIHRYIRSEGREDHGATLDGPQKELPLSFPEFLRSGAPFAHVDLERKQMTLCFPEKLDDVPRELRNVPSAVFNEVILKRRFGIDLSRPEDQGRVRYAKLPDFSDVSETGGDRFWLRPLDVLDVIQISQAGTLLPQKSTFFYPKIMTGFALHDLCG